MAKLAAANAKKNQSKGLGFLDNIKSFDVEDIWLDSLIAILFIYISVIISC